MKLCLMDRDNTINIDNGYTYKLSDMVIYDDFLKNARDLSKLFDSFIIVSNQSGIGRGFFSVQEVEKFNSHLEEKIFNKTGLKIDHWFFCPHKPNEGCTCRKPEIGLIAKYFSKYKPDKLRSVMIGDKETDMLFAKNLSIKGFKIRSKINEQTEWGYNVKGFSDIIRILRNQSL